jgi:EPS-associated MarR family transcriptional regulator
MKKTQDYFELLRKIDKSSNQSQRDLAKDLGFSLGKLNYCLKALQQKGLVKLKNFKNQKNKINYLQYIITPKGISLRTKLTIDFMKRKMQEFEELKKELKKRKK